MENGKFLYIFNFWMHYDAINAYISVMSKRLSAQYNIFNLDMKFEIFMKISY